MKTRSIYCCGCNKRVKARLTNGGEIYPHRANLAELPFWRCDTCENYVGCHHKTKNRTKPLGVIATEVLRKERRRIHAIIEPLCRSGKCKRSHLYRRISKIIGHEFHSAEIRTVEESKRILHILKGLQFQINAGNFNHG